MRSRTTRASRNAATSQSHASSGKKKSAMVSSSAIDLPLPVDFALWYLTSVVCTSGSKYFLNSELLPDAFMLTFLQLTIAAACGRLLLSGGMIREAPSSSIRDSSEDQGAPWKKRWALAMCFVFGFGSLNASISYIPVSLAMTLRAAEPLFSVALVAIFFAKSASEAVSAELGMTLLPIVAGTSMSSFGSAEFSFMGLVLVCIANVAFPLRTIIYKKLRSQTGEGNFSLFAGICWRAAVIMLAANIAIAARDGSLNRFSWVRILGQPEKASALVINGVCYYLYLQWSFIVLSKVAIVTHAVGNAMRRPVNIIFAVWFFSTHVSYLNAAGIVLACAGALWYAKVKGAQRAAVKAATPSP